MDSTKILAKLTIEEKISLLSGKDFWHTKGISDIVPSMLLTDGPTGVRKQKAKEGLNIFENYPATCFPTACVLAQSFDENLIFKVGEQIGREAIALDVDILLAPGVNIKRSPLCGRNFEYYSEDPYLAGIMARGFINGVQSTDVGACIKHYACNNQEAARLVNDSVVDERALNEIYLKPFEIAIKGSHPKAIMTSYNRINGVYASENKYLLKDKLKEFSFDGFVMTDWGAMNNPVAALKAGLTLEMPSDNKKGFDLIYEEFKKGNITSSEIDELLAPMISFALEKRNKEVNIDYDMAYELARTAASESMVLLKNSNNVLPLDKNENVLFVGELLKYPLIQGAGSSFVNPYKFKNVIECLDHKAKYEYVRGYDLSNLFDNDKLIEEATLKAKNFDKVVVVVGLSENEQAEGKDRPDMSLSNVQNELVFSLARACKNVIVVLDTPGVVQLPFKNVVSGIIQAGLSGEAFADAILDILYGDANPCGKLSETIPVTLNQTPSYLNFGSTYKTLYKESIYVGYRYYDTANVNVAYPFGYGLSYTEFEHSCLEVSETKVIDGDVTITYKVKNTGMRPGKCVTEIYVKCLNSNLFMPLHTLCGVSKIFLMPNEEASVCYKINKDAFKSYNVLTHTFETMCGEYELELATSSRDVVMSSKVYVDSKNKATFNDYREICPSYYNLDDNTLDIPKEEFEKLLGYKIKPYSLTPYDQNTTIKAAMQESSGYKYLTKLFKTVNKKNILDDLDTMPLRSLKMYGCSNEYIEGLILALNGKRLLGAIKIKKALKNNTR